eukprot:7057725-Prymnesium_polylepis.1
MKVARGRLGLGADGEHTNARALSQRHNGLEVSEGSVDRAAVGEVVLAAHHQQRRRREDRELRRERRGRVGASGAADANIVRLGKGRRPGPVVDVGIADEEDTASPGRH